MKLSSNWYIMQDVHDLGENFSIYRDGGLEPTVFNQLSEWEPLDRLGHLQTIFAKQPYFGRDLRYFNEAPWWYKREFSVAEDSAEYATLRFEGVDYFCKVWLNGHYIGEHEGYSSPFEFEVGKYLRRDRDNVLIVKVSAPWDKEVFAGKEDMRTLCVMRNMMKGTYEHDDTFVARDVNPIGIWGEVSLNFHGPVYFKGKPLVTTELDTEKNSAQVKYVFSVRNESSAKNVVVRTTIYNRYTQAIIVEHESKLQLQNGCSEIDETLILDDPKLWTTWDRGNPQIYHLEIQIISDEEELQSICENFGVRSVKMVRTSDETSFILNGDKIFLRGTSYFPDVYISSMTYGRYKRDLEAVVRAGFNAVRIHVHVQQAQFYDLCDEMGIAVIQDSDFNWAHPISQEWEDRAAKVFGDMVLHLFNHPSIICWICMNEPWAGGDTFSVAEGVFAKQTPGPRFAKEIQKLDPGRPYIKSSFAEDDLESGDSHNYKGSLSGADTHYTDIFGTSEKLNTEYGFDAPPQWESLRLVPEIYHRLKPLGDEGLKEIQYYQYRLLKYYTESYRIDKYAPCSGYVQFMFIDLCPQSFYGVYDWWGIPKEGLLALEESNMPLGVFMEHKDEPIAIWVVNDLLKDFGDCWLSWQVTDETGRLVEQGESSLYLEGDSAVRVCDFTFPVNTEKQYTISLLVHDNEGKLLTKNRYVDPFHHPCHPEGHPHKMSHELGMRLYWA